MNNLALYIGIGMIVAGLGLGVFIAIKVVEENRKGRDDFFDK